MKLPWKLILTVVCVVVILGAVFGFGSTYGEGQANTAWQEKWNDREDEIDKERKAAYEQAKLNADTANKALREEQENAKKRLALKDELIASARNDALRLQRTVSDYEQRLLRAGGDPTLAALTTGGTSIAEASILLARLYNVCVGERQELAGAFEQSLERGLTCQASFNKVRDANLP